MSNTLKLGNGQWATGKDTVLGYNSENNNIKPLPFSFSRASSATVVNKDGLIETVGSGEPRIDFKDNTKGALLLEPQRSNLVTYSEDFSNASWIKSNVSITSGSIVSPDGTTNASLMTITSGTSDQRIYKNVSYSGTNTVSVFAKASDLNWISIRIGSSVNKWYDLQNGVLGGSTITTSYVDADIQDYGNGWYRCTLVFTDNFNTSTRIYPAENNLDVTQTSGSVYIWGAQAEIGSYATSYIPTSGSAVTRVAEEVNNENYLMSGLTDMAMFVDYELPNGNSSGFRNQLGFRDNNNGNFYMIQFPNSNTHEFRYTGVANVNVDMTPSMSEQDFGLRRKLLYTKTGTTLKVFCNGVQVSTVTSASATTFSTTSEILNAGANYDIEMKIKDWKLYDNGFTDAEAIALTS